MCRMACALVRPRRQLSPEGAVDGPSVVARERSGWSGDLGHRDLLGLGGGGVDAGQLAVVAAPAPVGQYLPGAEVEAMVLLGKGLSILMP